MVSVTIRFCLDGSLALILCSGGLPTVCSACCFSNKGSSGFSPSHPLLPLRQRQKKTPSGDENSGKTCFAIRMRTYQLTRKNSSFNVAGYIEENS